ncbi:hypothetical protein QQ045_005933 [Rhodiola kirilowii]
MWIFWLSAGSSSKSEGKNYKRRRVVRKKKKKQFKGGARFARASETASLVLPLSFIMSKTRASTANDKLQDLSATVLQHTEKFTSIHEALSDITQNLYELTVSNARAEKQPLLPTPPSPITPITLNTIDTILICQRTPRLEIPLFTGENVTGWIFRIERFFRLHFTPPDQRLLISTFYMAGPALLWYQWMHSTHQMSTWEAFRRDLELRFGPSSFINHEAALYKLRQTSSITVYVLRALATRPSC